MIAFGGAGSEERLAEIINAAYDAGEAGIWQPGWKRISTETVARLVAAGEMAVAWRGGEPIGCVRIRRLDDGAAMLGMLSVHPSAHGTGLGRQLIAFAEAAFPDAHEMELELLIPRGAPHPHKQRLHEWYTRLGYRRVGRRDFDEPLLVEPADLWVYRKLLRARMPGVSLTVEKLVGLAPVIPVVVIDDLDDAVPLASALVRGGLPAIEVTLRTPVALAAIERIAAEVPGAVVGAGTLTTARQVDEAVGAGARFLVSPGATPRLLDALQASGVPFLPGTATASDIVALVERGITHAKLFPAELVGGVQALKAFAGPFPQMRFCPTGGIKPETAPDYLAQPNVVCVGGSWMAKPGDWGAVEAAAREAAALAR